MKASDGRVAGFDGVRGISVLLVMCSHQGMFMPLSPEWAARLVPIFGGTAMVTFFFLISGFLITSILLSEMARTGTISVIRFVQRRALRLLPALALYILVVTLLTLGGMTDANGKSLLLAFFYLYNFVGFGPQYSAVLAHTWSLAIEQHFYLIFPWAVRALGVRRLVQTLAWLLVVCVIMRGVMGDSTHSRWTLPGAAPILIGCLGAIMASSGRMTALFTRTRCLVAGLTLWLLPLYVPVAAQAWFLIPQSIGMGLILYWIYLAPRGAWVLKVLEFRPIVYAGTISYGMYLWQGLFVTTGPASRIYWFQKFPQNFVLTFVVAALSWHLVEIHFLKLKRLRRASPLAEPAA